MRHGLCLAVMWSVVGCGAAAQGDANGDANGGTSADATFGTVPSGGGDNQVPTGTITSPTEGQLVQLGDLVSFAAVVSDDHTAPEQLNLFWQSNLSGLLFEDTPNESGISTFTTDTLDAGTHAITLVIVDTDGGVGETTRSLVVNGPPGQPQIVIEPSEPRTGDDLHVMVVTDAVDPNRTADELTYHYTWFRDDEATQTTSTVLSHLTKEGERWRAEVRASDGTHDGLPASVEVLIGNTPPSCQGVLIDPSGGPTTTSFTCACLGREDPDDGDGAADTCTFTDGGAWLSDDCTLPAESTAKGMAVTCTVTPSDGEGSGEPVTSNPVVVMNSDPTTPTVVLSPAEGTVETLFTCDVVGESTDADGDGISYLRTWFVGAFANPGTGSTSVVAQNLVSDAEGTPASGGDEIFCRVEASDGDALSNPADTQKVALLNTPPSDGAVIITPASATEAHILNCVATGAEDPDAQDIYWTYQWFLVASDGVHTPIEGATGEALTGAHFDRGDVVTCTATPTDGVSEGAAVESKNLVTITNSLPTLEGASLTPEQVDLFGDFTCTHFGWNDLDDDPVEVTYAWFSVVDDVLTTLVGKVEATLAAATLPPGTVVRCQVTPKNGEALGAPVQSGDGHFVNAPPSLEGVTLTPDVPTVSSTLVCAPSGYTDVEGGGPFYDYAWKRNNQDIEDATQSTLSSGFAKGDGIRCVVTPNDGLDDGAPMPSNEVLIGNTTPQLGSVTIEPSFATPCETLSCEVSGLVEPDAADEVTLAYRWEVRDDATDSWTPLEATTQTLEAAGFAPDDAIRCHVRPTDGAVEDVEGEGLTTIWGAELQSNQATVINTPPTVESVALTPLAPFVGDTVTCAASGFDDPDCDPVEAFTFVWYVGGEALQDADGPTLSLDGISVGAQVHCQAIPDDGYTLGTGQFSNVVTVLNAPPTPVVVTIEAPDGADGPLTCALQLEPTDAEPLTYTWFWQVGEQVEIVGEQSLDEEFVSHCDVVRCRVSVSDGLDAVDSNVAETTLPSGDDCEDGNPCTSHGCLPEGGCVTTPNAADCDDSDPCTTGDTCTDGVCGGDADDCDDGNLCTQDSCNQATGCVHAFNPSVCDDQNPCTQDACDLAAGACVNEFLADGATCDGDGDGCTTGDSCFAGTCIIGQAADCPGEPDICQHQVCESLSPHAYICKTIFTADTVACEDGLQCTAGDHCNGFGTCVPGAFLDCSAGAGPCQMGTCTEDAGCTYFDLADESPCDADGDGCTEGDSCQAGLCLPGSAVDCDDDVCSVGECQSTGSDTHECAHVPVAAGLACGGEDFCVVDQVCDGEGACGGGTERDCEAEAGFSCHTAYCDSEDAVCVPIKAPDGSSCDDEDTCTVTDACQNGYCYGTGNACHEELLSVAVGGASRPSVADLGFGRYVVQWAGHSSDVLGKVYDYIRLSDPHGSREDEERNVAGDVYAMYVDSPYQLTQFTTPTAVAANGDFLTLSWTATGCACQAYNSCQCSAGNLVARSYDYLGTPVAENPALEVRTIAVSTDGSMTHPAGAIVVEDNDTDTLALPDGSWGLFKIDSVDASGPNLVMSLPIKGIQFTPLSSALVPGEPVELLTLSDSVGNPQMSSHRQFDVVALPDTTDFLLLWVKYKKKLGQPKWDQVLLQRFSNLGTPQGSSVLVFENLSAPANSIEGFEVRYVDATQELLIAWDDLQSNPGLRRVRWLRSSVQGEMLGTEASIVFDDSVGHQQLGDLAVFSDGGFVVTWTDDAGDVDGMAVKGRAFEVDDTPTTDVLNLNHEGVGDQFTPGVAVLANDEWVTAFADSAHRVWTRRYDRDGVDAVGRLERAVNTTTAGSQREATGVEGPDGDVMVAWSSPFAGTSDNEIVARLIDDDGLALNAETQLNTTIAGAQTSPDLAGTPDGWIAVWQSEGAGDEGEEIMGRMVTAEGSPTGAQFTVPTDSTGDQRHPSVAVGDDAALVVWDTDATDPGNAWHIGGRLLDLAGQPLGDELTLSTGSRAIAPVVAAVPDGAGYVVAWETKEGPDWDVVVMRANALGQPLTDPVVAHTTTTLDQTSATLAVGPSGYLLVCVTTVTNPTTTLGIGCQRLTTDGLEFIGPELVPHETGESQANPALTYLADGSWTVAWDTLGIDGDDSAIQLQRYSATGMPMGQRILVNRVWTGRQAVPLLVSLSGPTNSFLVAWQQGEDEVADITYRVLPGQ